MPIFYCLIAYLCYLPFLQAQVDCDQDPSCRRTKNLLFQARETWNQAYEGKNTNERCTRFNIEHYTLNLDMTQQQAQYLKGHCTVKFRLQQAGSQLLELDLLQMQVDSVVGWGKPLSYTYNDTLLTIQLPTLPKDSLQALHIYYQGRPQADKRWGGFYYQEDYVYNLGVGFASNPHNYGRVWHPCFDNFKERATYTFIVKTTNPQKAHCNGALASERVLNGITTRVWQQKDPIPSYLACIAVGDYTTVKRNYQGEQGAVPIELAANATDTNQLKRSFVHLEDAIAAYEYWYGPHRWNKVGYSLVPFRSGAMEHATNIAYPIYAANGTLKSESLMAHELGHSWWGNLVTCETAQDMWINEGMASYSEHLFWEWTYGKARYLKEIQENHYSVLSKAHEQEGGYQSIAAVPHAYTYGRHVYDKGAVVAHNLRWYLGDSLFRKGLRYVTNEYAFQHLNSTAFRDALTYATGQDMTAFFEDWVLTGGFPHFEVAAYEPVERKGSNYWAVQIVQKVIGRERHFRAVPLSLSMQLENGSFITNRIEVSGAKDTIYIPRNEAIQTMLVNQEYSLHQARYDAAQWWYAKDKSKSNRLPRVLGLEYLRIEQLADSAWVHLSQHPVAPTMTQTATTVEAVSERYWSVNGRLSNSLEATLTFKVKLADWKVLGLTSSQSEDLILLYRPNPNTAWQEHPAYSKVKLGNVLELDATLLKGDYAFAKGKAILALKSSKIIPTFTKDSLLYTTNNIAIQLATTKKQKAWVELRDHQGKVHYQQKIVLKRQPRTWRIPTVKLPKGNYFLILKNPQGQVLSSKNVRL